MSIRSSVVTFVVAALLNARRSLRVSVWEGPGRKGGRAG